MERKINISSLPEGHGTDKSTLLSLIERFYDKLTVYAKGELLLEVHFKEFHKKGAREQVETKITATGPGFRLHAMAEEWGAEKSLKKALDAIEKEIKKGNSKKTLNNNSK